jgi:bacillopeptidase F
MPNLNTELGLYKGGYLKVNATLKKQYNSDELYKQMEADKVPVKQRANLLIAQLQQVANATQPEVLQFIQDFEAKNPNQAADIVPLWIVNNISLQAKPELIKALAMHPAIDYIDMSIEKYLAPTITSCSSQTDDSQIGDFATSQANASVPNGSELGLKVIKAPFMWNLGYTGRGQFVMLLDDGTLLANPAMRDNFKGNYFPLSESYFSSNGLGLAPTCYVDASVTHGTHTAGTMCGLSRATNDTVGVAFNALWMGSGTIGAGCPGSADVLTSYQKALNPDNNPSTDDLPTVINNSWGYTTSGTTFCTGSYPQAVHNLEIANVSVVFSAGNSGPTQSSVRGLGYSHIYGLVDAFSVGNLQGDVSGYPINSSSSRGPSPCTGAATGSALAIKPEVSAPGTNIRSATGLGGFGSLTGTSMSAPHVSGAIALLAEAFPNVSALDLKLALYNSATDLGAVGEDNNYGKGIINLQAAYNYLIAAGNTPAPPPSTAYDIVVKDITQPKVACTSTIEPVVVFVNYGTATLTAATISYKLDAGTTQTYAWTGTAAPNQIVRATLPAITTTQTTNPHTLTITVNPSTGGDANALNNRRIATFNIKPATQINTTEAFEFSAMRLSKFTENDITQDGLTWKLVATGGLAGVRSAMLPIFDMPRFTQPNANLMPQQIDELISSPINVPTTGNIYLYFKRAYKQRSSIFKDSLSILVSQNCGLTYQKVYAKSGSTLASTPGNIGTSWVPALATDWATDSVGLSQFAGVSDILIKFVGKNGGGNNIYLDDVEVRNTVPTSANEILGNANLKIYPNPANETLWVEFDNETNLNAQINLMNMLGETVQTIVVNQRGENKHALNLNGLNKGIYLVRVCNNDGCKTLKIQKD